MTAAPPAERHWLFTIEAEDRPGAAASITAAFSGRGIQIERFIGYGAAGGTAPETAGSIVVTFRAFPHRMESIRRMLERLEAVRTVRVFDYRDDVRVVTSALVRLSVDVVRAARLIGPDLAVAIHAIAADAGGQVVILAGHPEAVDTALGRLRAAAVVSAAVCAMLPPA